MTSTVGEILEDLGWSVDCRGEIDVKGKGKMVTYFVDPRSAPKRKIVKASDINALGKASTRSKQDRHASDASLIRKPSLASIKLMLESRKGSFDLQATAVRHNSLPSVSIPELNSQDAPYALHKTMPSKLKNRIRGALLESLPDIEGTSFRELSVLDEKNLTSLESAEGTKRLNDATTPVPYVKDRVKTEVVIESENNGVGTSKKYSTSKGSTSSKEKKTHRLTERMRKKYYLSLEKFSEYEEDSYLSKMSGDSSSSSESEPNLSMKDSGREDVYSTYPIILSPSTATDVDDETLKSNVRVTLEKDATDAAEKSEGNAASSTSSSEGNAASSTSSSEGNSLEIMSNEELESSIVNALDSTEGRTSLGNGQFNPSSILGVEIRDRDGGT